MNPDQITPKADDLRHLTYSELRKEAKKYGIQRRLKAEKLIDLIMSKNAACDDCDEIFSTPAAKELNSSRKNKEKIFDENEMTPLATPRRGTYSLETSANKEKIFDENEKTPLATPRRGTFSLESPASVRTEDLSSVSLAVNASILDMSNVTVGRGSERKLRSRKVSFISPTVTPRTRRSESLRNRPKTPIASRTSINEKKPSEIFSGQQKRKSDDISATPQNKIAKFEVDFDLESSFVTNTSNVSLLPSGAQASNENVMTSEKNASPKNIFNTSKSVVIKEPASTKKATPGPIKSVIGKERTSTKRGVTPTAAKSAIAKESTSTKKGATPNFRRIHQKAFDKMESIDDYQKRKLLNSAKKISQRPNLKSKVNKPKSNIPAFSGIPFIPAVSHGKNLNISKMKESVGKLKASKENTPLSTKSSKPLKAKNLSRVTTPQPVKSKSDLKIKNVSAKKETPKSAKSKSKFDLKASLSRKLNYKPHRGPLKPLTESNSLTSTSFHQVAKEPVANKVVKENRAETRSMIRGVRINKRFELQMKNRKLN